MNKPRRLFDCIEEQLKMGSVETALAAKKNGQWRRYGTKEINDIVDRLAAGLLASGISGNDMSIEGRDKIALLSKNRPEWIFLDLAVQKIGAVLVPIYPTVYNGDLEFILNDTQVKMVFINDADMLQKVQNVLPQTPSIQKIYSFEELKGVANWKEILPMGTQEHYKQLATISERINTEDLFTIIYTSGTTGTPKGVMLTHHNVMSNIMSVMPLFDVNSKTRAVSFLPLNHIFERMVTYLFLFAGTNIYYPENLESLADTLKEVKPHVFATVPRLLEKVYERIMAKAEDLNGIKRKLFFWALSLAKQYDINKPLGFYYKLKLSIANKLVFNKWREGLGNEVQFIATGAAACPVRMIRIFTAAGIPILEGYGQTETSPVISVNSLGAGKRMFGTVGPVIDGMEVKIAEDGEILCKGPNVMTGYYKRPDLTEEVIKDGWLYTGDIGTIVNNYFLKITDRKKEIFKTSGGKYVAPQPIENKMAESPYIEQIMVVGANKKFTGALIVPDLLLIKDWCKRKGINVKDNDDVIHHPEVLKKFKSIVDKLNQNFSQVEQIKRFKLLPKPWSIENGELTPTLKLRRNVIAEKYHTVIESIYHA